jgi:hypothetical protein
MVLEGRFCFEGLHQAQERVEKGNACTRGPSHAFLEERPCRKTVERLRRQMLERLCRRALNLISGSAAVKLDFEAPHVQLQSGL